MARLTEPNGSLFKITLGICAVFFSIIVAMLGFWINNQAQVIEDVRDGQVLNGNRLTAIETRIGGIEDDIRAIDN